MIKSSRPVEHGLLDLPDQSSRGAFSLRASFAVFAIVVSLAIVAVFAGDAVRERAIATRVARKAAENLAESLAQQGSDTFDAADGALTVLTKRVRRDGIGRDARSDLTNTMSTLVATLPRIHLLVVFNASGRCVAQSIGWCGRASPRVQNRPYFRFHQSSRDLHMLITGPARGRFDRTLEIFASKRLERSDGTFVGVALAPVLVRFFERTFANVDVGRNGNITLFNADGTILARKPSVFLGVRFSAAGFRLDGRGQESSGSYATSAAADGVAHLFAFRRLQRYPLVVRVGVAENEYLADWMADTQRKAVVLVVILVIVAVLAFSLNRQIGQRKRAEMRLAELALLDGLTGVANRRQFDEVLDREWRHAGRGEASIALLMVDVDHFKSYNDLYGHQRGDRALVQIAQAIAADLKRSGDSVARYGGEEFVVILRTADVASALTVAERIREAILSLHLVHSGATSGVLSVSIGLAAIAPRRGAPAAALVEAADAALYEAKRRGRNCVVVSEYAQAFDRGE